MKSVSGVVFDWRQPELGATFGDGCVGLGAAGCGRLIFWPGSSGRPPGAAANSTEQSCLVSCVAGSPTAAWAPLSGDRSPPRCLLVPRLADGEPGHGASDCRTRRCETVPGWLPSRARRHTAAYLPPPSPITYKLITYKLSQDPGGKLLRPFHTYSETTEPSDWGRGGEEGGVAATR